MKLLEQIKRDAMAGASGHKWGSLAGTVCMVVLLSAAVLAAGVVFLTCLGFFLRTWDWAFQ